jgi:hypothetical protein
VPREAAQQSSLDGQVTSPSALAVAGRYLETSSAEQRDNEPERESVGLRAIRFRPLFTVRLDAPPILCCLCRLRSNVPPAIADYEWNEIES